MAHPRPTLFKQPWIDSPLVDGVLILGPSLLATGLLLLFPSWFGVSSEIPIWVWVLLIVGVDVAHVYSTLFRTYFDSEEFAQRRALYVLVPLMAWLGGVMLYSTDPIVFWRAMAYLAVFHFVRQQYGFMMIYSRKERGGSPLFRRIDKAAIYLATLYPLVYWHTHLPRNFWWFVKGDFIEIHWVALHRIFLVAYLVVLTAYIAKEIQISLKTKCVNAPKNLLLLGTALSWYMGIVCFNGDLAFTLTNVVSHGIPYMALVWIYSRRQSEARHRPLPSPWIRMNSKALAIPFFIGIILVFAYFEEGLWDGLVWRDHLEVFVFFSRLPSIGDRSTLAWVVPLLALPQVTHYILDGFIWRMQGEQSQWKVFTLKEV